MDQGWMLDGARQIGGHLNGLRQPASPAAERPVPGTPTPTIRIGLALGGGFARGIAHAGVLKLIDQHRIPIHCVTGVSAGSIVAAAYASGATPEEIARAGCSMRFSDVGRWSLGRLGLVGSERMHGFLKRLLKTYRVEEMRIPLGVVATDLSTGNPVSFSGTRRGVGRGAQLIEAGEAAALAALPDIRRWLVRSRMAPQKQALAA